MKKWIVSSLAVAICVIISQPLAAQEKKEEKKGPRQGGRYQEILKKFDANKDGKLDEKERAAARESMGGEFAKRRAEIIKKFDKDGDGKLNEEERAAAIKAMREHRAKHTGDRRKKDAPKKGGSGTKSDA